MSVTVEKLENSMAKLTIEVSAEEFDKAIDKVYRKQRGRINVPGFRKGKAPRKLIEQMYGTGVFLEDAINDTINSTYPENAQNCEISNEISSNPEIDVVQVEAGKPFIYTAVVAVKPPVGLGKYKGVEVEKPEISVSDEEVEAELKKEQEKNATYNDVTDRAVADGDRVNLNFEGFVDGVAFEGGKGEDYPLTIGSGSFIPGFEEQLIPRITSLQIWQESPQYSSARSSRSQRRSFLSSTTSLLMMCPSSPHLTSTRLTSERTSKSARKSRPEPRKRTK